MLEQVQVAVIEMPAALVIVAGANQALQQVMTVGRCIRKLPGARILQFPEQEKVAVFIARVYGTDNLAAGQDVGHNRQAVQALFQGIGFGEWVVPEHRKGGGRGLGNGLNPVIHTDRQLPGGGRGCGDLGLLHATETLAHQNDGQNQHAQGNCGGNQKSQ